MNERRAGFLTTRAALVRVAVVAVLVLAGFVAAPVAGVPARAARAAVLGAAVDEGRLRSQLGKELQGYLLLRGEAEHISAPD